MWYGCWKTWWTFGGINILLHISIDIQVFCSTFGKSKWCSPWSSFQIGRGERQMDRKDSTTCLIVSALSASPCSSWSLTSDTSFFLVASSVGLAPSAGLVGRRDEVHFLKCLALHNSCLYHLKFDDNFSWTWLQCDLLVLSEVDFRRKKQLVLQTK